MKLPMKLKDALSRIWVAGLLLWVLIPSPSASAGSATSGGGGAYVCADNAGNITSAHLVDLWESEHSPFEWKSDRATTIRVSYENTKPAQQQITDALAKLSGLDSGLGSRVGFALKEIQASVSPLPPGVSLTIPNDLQANYFPTGCPPAGMLRYNGATQALEVNTSIFDKLATQTDVAAAYLHESIYKVFRDGPDHAINSVMTRRLVACLFSQDCIANANFAVPPGNTAFVCTSSVMDAIVYSVYSGGWRFAVTRLGDTKYGAEVSQEMDEFRPGAIYREGIWNRGWFAKFGYYPIASKITIVPPSYPLDDHSIVEKGLAAQFSEIQLRYEYVIEPERIQMNCKLLH